MRAWRYLNCQILPHRAYVAPLGSRPASSGSSPISQRITWVHVGRGRTRWAIAVQSRSVTNEVDRKGSLSLIGAGFLAAGGLIAYLSVWWNDDTMSPESRMFAGDHRVVHDRRHVRFPGIACVPGSERDNARHAEVVRLSRDVTDAATTMRELLAQLDNPDSAWRNRMRDDAAGCLGNWLEVDHAGLVDDIAHMKKELAELRSLAADEAQIYLRGYLKGLDERDEARRRRHPSSKISSRTPRNLEDHGGVPRDISAGQGFCGIPRYPSKSRPAEPMGQKVRGSSPFGRASRPPSRPGWGPTSFQGRPRRTSSPTARTAFRKPRDP
jgi:hypothetical protein